MNDLGKALLRKVDDIIEVWVSKVRNDVEIESNRGMTYEAIHNGLPKVLASVATLLTSAFADEQAELEQDASEHGEIRAEQGFDIAEVVREYSTLRNVLLDALEPDLMTGSTAEVIKAIRKIDEAIDEVITISMECYIEHRLSLLNQMHAQLLLTNQELTHLVEIQKDNVSHLAHELKNPLNSIIGFSSILLRKQHKQLTNPADQPLEMKQIERILSNGQQLLRLINHTLEVARSESAQITLKIESVDVSKLVEMVTEAFEPSIEDKPITLKWNCDQAPKIVITDSLRIQQILTNLVSNAIRYTQEGSIHVICFAKEKQWAITVSDTGKGLSPEDQAKIFEPYFRGGNAEDFLPESSGLGLAVVSKLVNLLQGEIEIKSVLGQGSTFTVLLPFDMQPSLS